MWRPTKFPHEIQERLKILRFTYLQLESLLWSISPCEIDIFLLWSRIPPSVKKTYHQNIMIQYKRFTLVKGSMALTTPKFGSDLFSGPWYTNTWESCAIYFWGGIGKFWLSMSSPSLLDPQHHRSSRIAKILSSWNIRMPTSDHSYLIRSCISLVDMPSIETKTLKREI